MRRLKHAPYCLVYNKGSKMLVVINDSVVVKSEVQS